MGSKLKDIEAQLGEIVRRLSQLEEQVGVEPPPGDKHKAKSKKKKKGGQKKKAADEDQEPLCCAVPLVERREFEAGIDPMREAVIRSVEKKWVNGTELKYYFFENDEWAGPANQKDVVRGAFEEWESVGIGLKFSEVTSDDDADIRIGFRRGDGSWSYVGRDIWNRPLNERTMNFGWKLTGDSGRDTALHEIGHTMGFHHEQQNPFAGIEWDEEAVYRYFGGPPNNWPRDKTFHNVLRKLDANSVEGSQWDRDSIMQYAIPAGLVSNPAALRDGLTPKRGLSEIDRERVRLFYPPLAATNPELHRFSAHRLQLTAGQQANFDIRPSSTRRYTIQTFGDADTVMVLFENINGNLEHVAADDDGGWDRNARISQRLTKGREYVLRIRLFYTHTAGDTAVMMW